MPNAPDFWRAGSNPLLPALLSPASAIVAGITVARLRRPGWRAPVPVLCVGNATLGGAGKTTVGLDLARRLAAQGRVVHVLLRGYGGTVRGPHRVQPDETAGMVGDEALLYAPFVPVWVGGDRRLSAQAAVAAGARCLLMDDGLQNPGLHKDLSLLVIDGATGFGNGHVFPAGPLREPIAAAAARCQAAVLIGDDATGAAAALPAGLPVLHARLVPGEQAEQLAGRRVLAFTGIALPDKFFASVQATGAEIVARQAFPDHHLFRPEEREALLRQAERLDALPVTTAKDAARLPQGMRSRVTVLEVGLRWQDPARIEALLAKLFANQDAARG